MRKLSLILLACTLAVSAHADGPGLATELTPLMVAALARSVPAVRSLVDAGGSLTAKSPRGKTAFALAAEFNPDPEVVLYLLKAGSELETRDDLGRTPLIAAALHNTVPIVEALLAAGADARQRDVKGRTAYQYAAGEVFGPNRRLYATPVFWRLYEEQYR